MKRINVQKMMLKKFLFMQELKGALSYCPNPFFKENDSVFLKLLAPVVPSRRKKKTLFGKLLI